MDGGELRRGGKRGDVDLRQRVETFGREPGSPVGQDVGDGGARCQGAEAQAFGLYITGELLVRPRTGQPTTACLDAVQAAPTADP
jgi:hypothetical protein